MITQGHLTAELASQFGRDVRPPDHELSGIASLGAALAVWSPTIKRDGIDLLGAREYLRIRDRFLERLDELGCAVDAPATAAVLAEAAALQRAVLALMPVAGHA